MVNNIQSGDLSPLGKLSMVHCSQKQNKTEYLMLMMNSALESLWR